GVTDPGNTARLDLVKALLAKGDQELITELAKKNKVMAYGFGSACEPLPVLGAASAEQVKLDLASIQAEGRQTNLGGALRGALEKSRDAAIAGVILLSDGRRTMGPQGAEVARLLAQRKITNTFVLPIGDPSETQTVEVSRIDAPEKAFQKEPFRIK